MPNRQPNVVARRALAAATSALILAGAIMPAATAAAGAPPVLRTDYINTLKNVATTGNVLANDKDPAGGSVIFESFVPVSSTIGTLTIAANGGYTFTPATNWTGTASTTYQAKNANRSRTGTISITVRATNVGPIANDDDLSLVEDSTTTDVTADILANDTDEDGDTLWVTAVGGATGGTVDLTTELVTFTPSADLCGSDAAGFDYTITDGFGTTDSGHVTVDITCVNDAPVAVDDDASGSEDANVLMTAADLAADDTDVDTGDSLTVIGVSNPSGGTVVLDGGSITFTPTADLCGNDAASFDYTVGDGNGGTDTGSVTIDLTCVNDLPVAVDDTVSVTEDAATDVTETLLDNDADIDTGDPLSITGVSGATGGTVELDGDVVTFTPSADLCGSGEGGFDYDVSDGTSTDSGHVTVDITCVNDAPMAVDDDASGSEDTNLEITPSGLTTDDSDVENDSLTVTEATNATGGTVSLDAGTITFTPTADLCGPDVAGFDYTVEDGNGGSDTGHVAISLTCENDAPVAGDDDTTITEDTATDVTGGLLDDDTDVDEDALTISDVSGSTGGLAVLDGGVITFTPTANLCGDNAAGFDYTVHDGTTTDTGHVTIDITCVNDAPTAVDDDEAGTEDTNVSLASADLASDDTDVELDTLTMTGVSGATGGTVVRDSDTGAITFTPTANLCGNDAAGFDYTVDDGTASDTGHVSIDLTCVNDAPNAVDDTASVFANSAAADYDVLANDTDVEHDTLTVQSPLVDAAAGTASVVGGKVRFTPKTGFTGQAVITYTVSDGTDTGSATLTITVGGDVTGPVVTAAKIAFGSGRVDSTAPLKISWSATDVPSGVASYQVQVSIAGGTYKSVYSGTATSITKLYPFGKSLVFRVRAKDTAGNWSAWVKSPKRTIASYQNSSAKVVYRSPWRMVRSTGSSGVGYAYTTTRGNAARLTFSGRSVLYVAPRTSGSGKVKVYIDGKLLGRFDLYRSSTRLGQIIARATFSAGTHTIRVVADTSGKRTSLDAFIVLK